MQHAVMPVMPVMPVIPNNIHQIWFQGENVIPAKYRAFQSTWKDTVKHPSYTYNFWDISSIENLLTGGQISHRWNKTYHSFPTMIQKIDFAKYIILYMFGGIYIDMDVFSISPLSKLQNTLSNKDFVVFEHNTPCITITMNKLMGLQGDSLINNAVILSSIGNPKMRTIIETCCDAQARWKKNFLSLQLRCLVTTGPIVFTNCIRKFENWETMVMPAVMFEPFTTLEMARLSIKEWEEEQNGNNNGDNVQNGDNYGGQEYDLLMKFLSTRKDMTNVIGIHVLDLNWFKNGKNNWKFRAYRGIQKVKKNIISVYK
jgi:inositol phosphorylceramide mannosyltransferase catalytic subunit